MTIKIIMYGTWEKKMQTNLYIQVQLNASTTCK